MIQDYDVTFLEMETIKMVQGILGLREKVRMATEKPRYVRTSITSSNTTNAVPLDFCSVPIRI